MATLAPVFSWVHENTLMSLRGADEKPFKDRRLMSFGMTDGIGARFFHETVIGS
jgi:hypothetical protein